MLSGEKLKAEEEINRGKRVVEIIKEKKQWR